MFGIDTLNPVILEAVGVVIKLAILVVALVYFQRLYSKISKESAEGYSPRFILVFRAILTAFSVIIITSNFLPWLKTDSASYNGFELIIARGEYLLVLPLVFIVLALALIWRNSSNSPALVAPMYVCYVALTIFLGLLSKTYDSSVDIGPGSISLIIAGIAVFPAILYAEGMPHPANRILYYAINLGKSRYDEAIHHMARALSLSYRGSTVPIGFSSAKGTHKDRSISVYGREGGIASNKIAVIKVGATLNADDIILARPKAWAEAYLKAFDMEEPEWFLRLIEDDKWEPATERFEMEIDDSIITDEYEVIASSQKKALNIIRKVSDHIIDLDADIIVITKDGVYSGYDFSRMRMAKQYMLDKVMFQIELAGKLESKLKAGAKKSKSAKKSVAAN